MVENNRLKFISSLLKGYNTVLDIGTDHGLVLKYAFDMGYIKNGIASDLREKPLISAKNNLKDYPCEFILSNGFSNIKKDFDCCVICGMGSHLISEILSDSPNNNAHYILGTNDKEDELREYLSNNNFKILDEYIIFDKFYYIFMKVTKTATKQKLSKEDIILGPVLKTKKNSVDYYQQKAIYLKDLIAKVDQQKAQLLKGKLKYFKKN